MATPTSTRFTWTVDPETFAVTIFDNTLEHADIPAIFQPHHPDANGDPFTSQADAEAWVAEFLTYDHPAPIEQPEVLPEAPAPTPPAATPAPAEAPTTPNA